MDWGIILDEFIFSNLVGEFILIYFKIPRSQNSKNTSGSCNIAAAMHALAC